jgi:hypothetical protein
MKYLNSFIALVIVAVAFFLAQSANACMLNASVDRSSNQLKAQYRAGSALGNVQAQPQQPTFVRKAVRG